MSLQDKSRRRLLKAIGVGGLVASAGCAEDEGENGDPLEDGVDDTDGGDTDGDDTDGGDDSEPSQLVTHDHFGDPDGTQINFWLLPDSTPDPNQQPTSEVYAESVRPLYEEWAENHPDYYINPEYQTDLEQMQTELLQATARDDPPALSEVDSFWLPDHWDNLTSLNDVIEDDEDWFPFVREIARPDEEWKAVWRNTDCRALYYRVDLIDQYSDGEPPRTWDELVDVGTTISEEEDMDGYLYNGGRWEATTFDNLAHFWAQGGELVDINTGEPVLGEGDNYDALLNTFQWLRRTVESGLSPERVVNIDDYALLSEAALNGDAAMFLGGSWQIHSELIPEVGEDEIEDRWEIAPIPQQEASMESTGTGGWTVATFTEDENLQQPAKDFCATFADTENMGTYCEIQGQLPTRPSVYEENEFFSEDHYMQQFQDLLEAGTARPGVPIYRTISAEWQIATGRVLTGDETPEDAIQIMLDNIQQEYESS